MADFLTYLQKHQKDILDDLRRLVQAESPSYEKEYVDRCGNELQVLFRKYFGIEAEVIQQATTGNHLRFTYGTGDSQILILTHFDTVWDIGRLSPIK
jgi:glutamate carboxypeptidase